ncbi:MAG: hypothetical protein OZSIB_1819 [Candidatus Ozemobacter sibiricus]|uniref:BK channel n=1 Tax=Candidatus Ozemobacter sibiricus TaxID=2268124 RepID=A0A367ZIT4_9BACT|nr:MAG: hypothetical protein OZSIB_1819 [Candidatus Ozemobacter sibiricus]
MRNPCRLAYHAAMTPTVPPLLTDPLPAAPPAGRERRRYPRLRRFLDHPYVGLIILVLVLVSVVLLLFETFADIPESTRHWMELANDVLTVLFFLELALRWLVFKSTGKFLRSHWLDILALLPMLRVFRLSRVFALVRLLRIFSLGALLQNRVRLLGTVFEARAVELGLLLFFIGFAITFGAVGLAQFEVGHDADLLTHSDAFWKATFSLLTGEYASYPRTLGGRLIFAVLTLFGMGVFAMLTGTVSAVMMEKMKESAMHRNINPEDLQGHIIICGFSAKAATLVTEFQLEPHFADADILLVSELANIEELTARGVKVDRVYVLKEDFTHIDTLHRAGVERARAAVILSEGGGHRTTQDIDARTILCALSIEKLRPGIHTSAELYHPEFADHLKLAGVEDVVIQGEFSGKLLARIAANEGVLAFFKDLLSRTEGNSLVFQKVPPALAGVDFPAAMTRLHTERQMIPVGVRPAGGELLINPATYRLQETDELLVIAPTTPQA